MHFCHFLQCRHVWWYVILSHYTVPCTLFKHPVVIPLVFNPSANSISLTHRRSKGYQLRVARPNTVASRMDEECNTLEEVPSATFVCVGEYCALSALPVTCRQKIS